MFYRNLLMMIGGLVSVAVLGACRVAPTATPPTAIASQVTSASQPTATIPARPTETPTQPVLATPGTRSTEAAPRPEVEVGDNFYYPSEIIIKVGTTLRWKHVGQSFHDVAAVDASWGVAVLPHAGYWERTFSREGIYDYYCAPHPQMTGRVIVTP